MKDLVCRDERRRQVIRDRGHNGVDYVDVNGTHLCVHFITGIPPEFLPEKGKTFSQKEKDERLCHIVIKGGRRITDIHAINFDPHATDDTYDEDCLGIDLDKEGDWSTYTLCFVECEDGQPSCEPMKSLDPRYACIDFTFKIDCPAEIDCKTEEVCPPDAKPHPAINYLAKDYASFRQLILDRLALIMPEWRERHVPDIGIAIVELLAYVGDYLSYYQDAVATEAYLDTARQRISVRRHARLVDYRMHDGCNARAFLFLQVRKDDELDLGDIYFSVDSDRTIVFEPLDAREMFPVFREHNEILIYTWGDQECCIPKGATRATLIDGFVEEEPPPPPPQVEVEQAYQRRLRKRASQGGYKAPAEEPEPPPQEPQEPKRRLQLQPGDFLLFEELACAGTAFITTEDGDGGFDPEKREPLPDVDRTHRHVVRLTKVTPRVDELMDPPQAVLDVEWDRADAMPFQLCVSAIGIAPPCDYVAPLAVARGNILLVDHGTTLEEDLDPILGESGVDVCEGEDDPAENASVPRLYRPALKSAPLTFAQPLIDNAPASVLLQQSPREAVAAVRLTSVAPPVHGDDPEMTWTPVYDLLGSGPDDAEFVAEIDDDGRAHLRFGDGRLGRAVEVGMSFSARYRAGNGRAGLVGAETITRVWFRSGTNDLIEHARNPLPSTGALPPEPVAEVKMRAPIAFRKDLQRAITADDYATLARFLRFPVRNPQVQNAAGSLVWSGSWYEADVAVDPFGSATLSDALDLTITNSLQRYRRMGHDLRVAGALLVPLRIELELCIKSDYLRAHVLAAARDAVLRLFQPDNTTFAEAVYVSRLVAAVMAVDGVKEVKVTRLERLAEVPKGVTPDSGVLKLKPFEIARLDNDPASPENGILDFVKVQGGR